MIVTYRLTQRGNAFRVELWDEGRLVLHEHGGNHKSVCPENVLLLARMAALRVAAWNGAEHITMVGDPHEPDARG